MVIGNFGCLLLGVEVAVAEVIFGTIFRDWLVAMAGLPPVALGY